MNLLRQRRDPCGIELIVVGRKNIRSDFDDNGACAVHDLASKGGGVLSHGGKCSDANVELRSALESFLWL